jgi:hypothetical protein
MARAGVLKPRGSRRGLVAALTGVVVFACAACTSDGESSVSGAGSGSTTSVARLTDSMTTASTEPPVARDGAPVDPTVYVREQDYTKIAQAGTVHLPTWLPAGAGSAEPIVIAVPPFVFEAAWIDNEGVDPTTGEEVRIDVTRETPRDGDPVRALPPRALQGNARTYHTTYGGTCPPKDVIRDGPVLVWRAHGYTYAVSVSPRPGCSPRFSIRDAVAFADSLVPCGVHADSLDCATKPS